MTNNSKKSKIKVYNNNASFGLPGPFEVESVEAFVEEMKRESFPTWALEAYLSSEELGDVSREEFIAAMVDELATEFEAGLEIVS